MSQRLAALILAVCVVGIARADVPPPPGFVRVVTDHKIVTAKDYPDYKFFTVMQGPGKTGADGIAEVKLNTKTPVVIAGKGRRPFNPITLVAVPGDAAKNYKDETQFFEAIRAGKVDGLLRANASFSPVTTVKGGDPGKTMVVEHTLEKIDAKGGLELVRKKDGAVGGSEEPESAGAAASTPRGGVWIAGIAAAMALTFGGLWLTGRGRRKN